VGAACRALAKRGGLLLLITYGLTQEDMPRSITCPNRWWVGSARGQCAPKGIFKFENARGLGLQGPKVRG
jgi:hypothetical protein